MPRHVRPTQEQIDAEIHALQNLKSTVPDVGLMGNNHNALDAACAVLRDRMTHDNIFDTYGEDAGDESDFDQAVLDGALEAYHWRVGEDGESPSQKWAK